MLPLWIIPALSGFVSVTVSDVFPLLDVILIVPVVMPAFQVTSKEESGEPLPVQGPLIGRMIAPVVQTCIVEAESHCPVIRY